MSDWDAARYHRISGPQFDWGQKIIGRLEPSAGERILDLGCGTARLSQEIARVLTPGLVVGLDLSGAMLAVARAASAEGGSARVAYVQATATAVPFHQAFDAVFSAATLHWIPDHRAVFAAVFDALAPGGRFVAQCGGDGNLRRLLGHTRDLMDRAPYDAYFRGWEAPWYFAEPSVTARRLEAAGFAGASAWLEEAPVDLADAGAYAEFVSCVCIRHHLDRLPLNLREPFANELTMRAARDSPPFVLDYWRLNVDARRAAG